MPLPWLIGAAVAAAAVAVVNAVSDDDTPSSSDSGAAERRRQEREALLQRKRDGLVAKVEGLKTDRLAEANDLLASSAKTLSLHLGKTNELSASDFESAMVAMRKSESAYAWSLDEILTLPSHSQNGFNQEERTELLVNLQMLESLAGPFTFTEEEQRNLSALWEVDSRLDRLQNLKLQLAQQG